jgi:hypothetical protein
MDGRTDVKQYTPSSFAWTDGRTDGWKDGRMKGQTDRGKTVYLPPFFSITVDGRNLIFGHKRHIGIPYCG